MKKICPTCNKERAPTDFYVQYHRADGSEKRFRICIICMREKANTRAKRYYHQHKHEPEFKAIRLKHTTLWQERHREQYLATRRRIDARRRLKMRLKRDADLH